MRYIIAVHVPTAGMALLPILLGWPLVLFPVHVVFLEFVIDPACSIVFEAEPADRDTMRRPPRPASARLFGLATIAWSVAQGVLVLAAVVALYAWAMRTGVDEGAARAMAFAAMVLGNLALILVNRPRRARDERREASNPTLWVLLGGAVAGLLLVLYVEPLREVFRFAAPSPQELGASALAAAGAFALLVALSSSRASLGAGPPSKRFR
jgi:Ca2+-transporting ATPase